MPHHHFFPSQSLSPHTIGRVCSSSPGHATDESQGSRMVVGGGERTRSNALPGEARSRHSRHVTHHTHTTYPPLPQRAPHQPHHHHCHHLHQRRWKENGKGEELKSVSGNQGEAGVQRPGTKGARGRSMWEWAMVCSVFTQRQAGRWGQLGKKVCVLSGTRATVIGNRGQWGTNKGR